MRKIIIVFFGLILFLILFFLKIKIADTPEANFPKLTEKQIKLVFVGDVMLGRTVMTKSHELGNYNYVFEKTRKLLTESDLTVANLENPIVSNCPYSYSGLKFCTDEFMLKGLTQSGIDIVNIANNHSGNYGKSGIAETLKYLNESKIEYVGLENILYKQFSLGNKNKYTISFLGFDLTQKDISLEQLNLIKEANSKSNLVIVNVHWGTEYTKDPSLFQINNANLITENGAHIIVGHHPHWVGKISKVNDKVVFYSLGNFIFDQMWSENTRKGLAVQLVINKNGIKEINGYDIYMNNWAQPEIVGYRKISL